MHIADAEPRLPPGSPPRPLPPAAARAARPRDPHPEISARSRDHGDAPQPPPVAVSGPPVEAELLEATAEHSELDLTRAQQQPRRRRQIGAKRLRALAGSSRAEQHVACAEHTAFGERVTLAQPDEAHQAIVA